MYCSQQFRLKWTEVSEDASTRRASDPSFGHHWALLSLNVALGFPGLPGQQLLTQIRWPGCRQGMHCRKWCVESRIQRIKGKSESQHMRNCSSSIFKVHWEGRAEPESLQQEERWCYITLLQLNEFWVSKVSLSACTITLRRCKCRAHVQSGSGVRSQSNHLSQRTRPNRHQHEAKLLCAHMQGWVQD